MSGGATYGAAGVSLQANERAVELIAKAIADAGATRPEVLGDIGGFAAAFSARNFARMKDPLLVSATDGVGTKLSIAQTLGRHDTVGFDVVAMNVDDLVCVGAEPLFFLDYISCGRNEPERIADIVGGVARACAFAGCALVGGEISEHPGIMAPDEYDLVGFCVGVVDRAEAIGPDRVRAGDVIVGLRSSGLHSNGYSLVRKLVLDNDLSLSEQVPGGRTLGEELLEPCRIHAPAVLAAIEAGGVHAAAHITGGGIAGNLVRVLPSGLAAHVDTRTWDQHPIFSFLQEVGGIAETDMRQVFNLGLGMAIITEPDNTDAVLAAATEAGETAMVVGEIRAGEGVTLR